MPDENRDWVNHNLTDAGWRGRMVARHLAVITPVSVALGLLPAEWGIRVLVALLVFLGSTFIVAIGAADIRAARLRQHRLPVSGDPERGHPSH